MGNLKTGNYLTKEEIKLADKLHMKIYLALFVIRGNTT